MYVEFEGIFITDRYLNVTFTSGFTGAKRLEIVRVPWGGLTDPEVLRNIDRAVRARLYAAWDGPGEFDERLPGID